MKETLKKAVKINAEKSAEAQSADDAMKFAQAALNIANAMRASGVVT